MSRIVNLTTVYEPRSQQRADEYDKCLSLNSSNTDIDKIIVFFEGETAAASSLYPSLNHDKIELIAIDHRPDYKVFFDYANKHLQGDCIIISNADIYFDDESQIGRAKEIPENHLWALCRYNYNRRSKNWELQGGGRQGSSDSWIFRSSIADFRSDIVIGNDGCDSYICQKAVEGGVVVSNPARSLISKHEHNAEERNCQVTYKEKQDYMQCGYRTYCPPASALENSVCASNKSLRYRVLALPLSIALIRAYRKIRAARW